MYHSLDELLTAKELALKSLAQRTQGLNAEQLNLRPIDGGWTISEVLEHLAIVEGQLLFLVQALTKRAEKAAKPDVAIPPFSVTLEPHLSQSRNRKIRTQERSEPTGKVEAAASMKTLRELEAQLMEMRPRLERVNLHVAQFPHWTFGPLDLSQWLAFIGLHEERHLRQIEAIIASPEFPQIRNG